MIGKLTSIFQWWLKQDVLKLLIDKLDAKNEVEVHINVTYILAEIINRSTKPGMKVQEDQLNPLAESLLSKEIVNYYITKLLENVRKKYLILSTILGKIHCIT